MDWLGLLREAFWPFMAACAIYILGQLVAALGEIAAAVRAIQIQVTWPGDWRLSYPPNKCRYRPGDVADALQQTAAREHAREISRLFTPSAGESGAASQPD